jgi:hypothetical protein
MKKTNVINVPEKALRDIAALANRWLNCKTQVDSLTNDLKVAQDELNAIELDLLPSAMETANLTRFTTSNGAEVTVKDDMNVSLKSGDKSKAFQWLRDEGYGDVIRHKISMEFGRGQENELKRARKALGKIPYNELDDANTASVKAVLKRALESGRVVPLPIFGAYRYTKAVVKINN